MLAVRPSAGLLLLFGFGGFGGFAAHLLWWLFLASLIALIFAAVSGRFR